MPRLINDDPTMQQHQIGGGNFTFQGTRIESLGATEYTLVTIAIDETGSTDGFQDALRQALVTAVKACKKSPRSDNILIRVIKFSSALPGGIEEIHGFKPLSEINPDDYEQFSPGGLTPLCDAAYSAVGAMLAYAKQLTDADFYVNGIVFVATDGDDNRSVSTPRMIKEETEKAVTGEAIESLVTILIGINASQYAAELADFQKQAGFTQYIDASDATAGKLAKLAEFVSQSVSSQSQALGTGGPSQSIATTF